MRRLLDLAPPLLQVLLHVAVDLVRVRVRVRVRVKGEW